MKDSDQLDAFGSFIVSNLLVHSIHILRTRLHKELNENIKMPKEYRNFEKNKVIFGNTKRNN